jgi:hypothetical protein
MKRTLLLAVVTVVTLVAVEAGADTSPHIAKRCTSSSGMSVYDLNFSLPLRNGQIRYRYMEQGVLT